MQKLDKKPERTQHYPPIPTKRYFTIGETSRLCMVKNHVLRFWEQEFPQLKPVRRGKRRYYTQDDVALIRTIRDLLYEDRFTIDGARNQLYQRKKLREIEIAPFYAEDEPLNDDQLPELDATVQAVSSDEDVDIEPNDDGLLSFEPHPEWDNAHYVDDQPLSPINDVVKTQLSSINDSTEALIEDLATMATTVSHTTDTISYVVHEEIANHQQNVAVSGTQMTHLIEELETVAELLRRKS